VLFYIDHDVYTTKISVIDMQMLDGRGDDGFQGGQGNVDEQMQQQVTPGFVDEDDPPLF
jgi:hypothetical protein